MIKFTFLCSLQKLVLKTSADYSEVIYISCQLSQVIILQYMHPTDYYYQLVTFSIVLYMCSHWKGCRNSYITTI